jgi:adenylate cyclase
METSAQFRAERRLAAILAADTTGDSRLIGADEEGTLGRIRLIRAEVIDQAIAIHRCRLVKTTWDGLLIEFLGVVDALSAMADAVGACRCCEKEFTVPTRLREHEAWAAVHGSFGAGVDG